MKQGGAKAASGGFTIVETLIVLAVTGILLFSAVLLISGRQNKTEFMTAINNAQQQLQQILNETQSGYYSGSTINCLGNKTASQPIVGGGANQGCVFLGKVIQLGTNTDPSQLITYPIVGNQQYTVGGVAQEVDTIGHAYPTVLPNAQATYELQNGLTVYGPATSTGAFSIVSNLANYSNCGGSLCSGSQQFNLASIHSSTPNSLPSDVVTLVNNANAANFDFAANTISVCLASATTNQSGLFTIGGSASLNVNLQIFGDATC